MARCLISFGANMGDPGATIQAAAARLREHLCSESPSKDSHAVSSFQLSRFFRTPPVGGPAGQPPFINAVAAINTSASPWDVWYSIRSVEKEFGRERNLRWEARRIDLDILLYDQARIWTPHLKIPHPRMCMRRFILLPAADVARDWLDPVSGWTIGQLAENVYNGASNFVLVADGANNPESLLAEVARRTGAMWQTPIQSPDRLPPNSNARWVSAVTAVGSQIECVDLGALQRDWQPKLLIVLAPAIPNTDVAWEDYHLALADKLAFLSKPTNLHSSLAPVFPGPRYLLASDDPDWAIQELIAALEAMDCPVEPL